MRLVLALLAAWCASVWAQYPMQATLINKGTIKTNVTVIDATTVLFDVSCSVPNGYMSIGWTTTGNFHSQSDMIVGFMTSTATGALFDTYSDSLTRPTQDNTNNVQLQSAATTNQGFRMTFTRKMDTGDATKDVALTNQANLLYQWASGTHTGTTLGGINKHSQAGVQANVNLIATTATPTTAPPGQKLGEFKSDNGNFQVNYKTENNEVKFDMVGQGNPSYVAISISPAGAALECHADSDTYIGYMNSAGSAAVSDGYSNSESRPTPDGQNDAIKVSGSSTGGVLTISFSRPLTTGDGKDKDIANMNYQMGWALGPSGGGTTPTTFNNHGASLTARGGFVANLISGANSGSTSMKKPLNPGTAYTITIVVLVATYALVRLGYKIYKRRKQSTNIKIVEMPNATPAYDDYDTNQNSSEAFYFKGSVAVQYQQEIRQGAAMAKNQPLMSATSDPLDQEKQVGSKYAVAAHKLAHIRLPKSQVSLGDVLMAGLFLFINIGFASLWKSEGYTPGLAWGFLAAANSFFVALPATRNSVMVWMLGIPFDKTIMFHRWLARWLWIQVVVHWGYYGPLGGNEEFPYWTGVGGWLFMTVIVLTSEGYVRRNYFNVFFYSHFLFFGFYIITCYHTPKHFAPFAYAAAAFYGLDRALRLFWGAWPTKTVRLEAVEGAVRVVFKKHCAAQYKVGQYVFLNFPGIDFLEWHPFTLANGPDEEHLEVLIKGLGDHTRKLVAAAESSQQLYVRVDGPYGKWPFNFARFKSVVMVAGGVGVTPSIALIRHVFNINRNRTDLDSCLTDVFFVWSCKNEREFQWYRDMLEEAMKRSALKSKDYPTLHAYVHITQPTGGSELPEYVRAGRVNVEEMFGRVDQQVPSNENLRVAVIACGPAALVNDTWDQTSKRTGGNRRFDFHHETFEF